MSDFREQIGLLMTEADSLEGPQQVALIEQAVRLADSHGDLDLGFKTRRALVSSAAICQPEVCIVAYSWCLAQCDREPTRFPEKPLLWAYRLVIHGLPLFPEIPRTQIESLLADMAHRYRRAGTTLRGCHLLRRNVAIRMGDMAAAAKAHQDWLAAPQGWLADSADTELNFLVEYLGLLNEDEELVRQAAPVVEGKIQKGPIRENTFAELLMPLLRLGRLPEAMACHRAGYRLSAHQFHSSIEDLCDHHIPFLALTGNFSRAVKLVERLYPVALAMAAKASHFQYYLASRLLMECLRAEEKETLKLHLPETFPRYEVSGKYRVAELADCFLEQLEELAEKFDTRNGNDYFHGRIGELHSVMKWRTPFPLVKR